MVEHFQYVLDNYDNGEKKVNSSSKLYDELIVTVYDAHLV